MAVPEWYVQPVTNARTMHQVIAAMRTWFTKQQQQQQQAASSTKHRLLVGEGAAVAAAFPATAMLATPSFAQQPTSAATLAPMTAFSEATWQELEAHLVQTCLPDVTRYRNKVLVTIEMDFQYGGTYYKRWLMAKQRFAELALVEDIYLGDVNGIDSKVTVDFLDFKCETQDDPYTIAAIMETLGAGEEPSWVQGVLSSGQYMRPDGERTNDSEALEAYIRKRKRDRATLQSELHASDEDSAPSSSSSDDDEEEKEQEAREDEGEEEEKKKTTTTKLKTAASHAAVAVAAAAVIEQKPPLAKRRRVPANLPLHTQRSKRT